MTPLPGASDRGVGVHCVAQQQNPGRLSAEQFVRHPACGQHEESRQPKSFRGARAATAVGVVHARAETG